MQLPGTAGHEKRITLLVFQAGWQLAKAADFDHAADAGKSLQADSVSKPSDNAS